MGWTIWWGWPYKIMLQVWQKEETFQEAVFCSICFFSMSLLSQNTYHIFLIILVHFISCHLFVMPYATKVWEEMPCCKSRWSPIEGLFRKWCYICLNWCIKVQLAFFPQFGWWNRNTTIIWSNVVSTTIVICLTMNNLFGETSACNWN